MILLSMLLAFGGAFCLSLAFGEVPPNVSFNLGLAGAMCFMTAVFILANKIDGVENKRGDK